MNFTVEKKCLNQSRLGTINCANSQCKDVSFSTPLCLLYTMAGSVPHVTGDVLQKATNEKMMTVMPLPNIYCFKDALTEFKRGIAKFVSMEDYPLYICNQDPAVLTPTGYNTKAGVSVWNNSGKSSVDVNKFVTFMEDCKPVCYQALSDGDSPKGCSKKRVSNSVRSSLELLDKCLERHKQSEALQNSAIFGSIEGGYDLKARQFSAKHTAAREVDGFVIEGFHSFGPETVNVQFSDIEIHIKEIFKFLPEGKPRVIHGVYNPLFIIEAVEAGIDVFDASLTYVTTEKGSALVFPFDDDNEERRLEISLRDEIYQEDFSPLLKNCSCYTCRNFTKAYINHLLMTSEMLAPVLLMMHNLQHFLGFFKSLRNALKCNELDSLKCRLKCVKTVND